MSDCDRVREEETVPNNCYTLVTTGAEVAAEVIVGLVLFELILAESLQFIALCRRFGNPLCLQDEH